MSLYKLTISFTQHGSSQIYILFIVITDESVQIVNSLAFLEVSDGEVLIPIATNILIELSPASPVLPKTPTMNIYLWMTHNVFYTKFIYLGKNWKRTLLRIMILKTFSIKNWRMKERLKLTQLKSSRKELECLKRKTSALLTKLKISKRW